MYIVKGVKAVIGSHLILPVRFKNNSWNRLRSDPSQMSPVQAELFGLQ